MKLIKRLTSLGYPFESLSEGRLKELKEISLLLENQEHLYSHKEIVDGLSKFQTLKEEEVRGFSDRVKKIIFESSFGGTQVHDIEITKIQDLKETTFAFDKIKGEIPVLNPNKESDVGTFSQSHWWSHTTSSSVMRTGKGALIGNDFIKDTLLADRNNWNKIWKDLGSPKSLGQTLCDNAVSLITSTSRKEFIPSSEAFWDSIYIIRYRFKGNVYREEVRFRLTRHGYAAPHYWTSLLFLTANRVVSTGFDEKRLITRKDETSIDRVDFAIRETSIIPLQGGSNLCMFFSPLSEWRAARALNNNEYREFFNDVVLPTKVKEATKAEENGGDGENKQE